MLKIICVCLALTQLAHAALSTLAAPGLNLELLAYEHDERAAARAARHSEFDQWLAAHLNLPSIRHQLLEGDVQGLDKMIARWRKVIKHLAVDGQQFIGAWMARLEILEQNQDLISEGLTRAVAYREAVSAELISGWARFIFLEGKPQLFQLQEAAQVNPELLPLYHSLLIPSYCAPVS